MIAAIQAATTDPNIAALAAADCGYSPRSNRWAY
jgi:hypothetical protein